MSALVFAHLFLLSSPYPARMPSPANAADLVRPVESSRQASPDIRVQIDRETARHFAAAFKTAAAQAGLCIVAENEPLHRELSPDSVLGFPQEGLPAREMIERLAALYDYSAERRGDVVLLKKRFTNPKDIPDITPKECRHTLENILRLCDPFRLPKQKSVDTSTTLMNQLIASLSAGQLTELKKGMQDGGFAFPLPPTSALPLSHLNPAQKDIYQKLILQTLVTKSMDQIRWVNTETNIIADDRTAFLAETRVGTRCFGYEVPDESGVYGTEDDSHDKRFRPLSSPYMLPNGGVLRATLSGQTDRLIGYMTVAGRDGKPVHFTDPTEPGSSESTGTLQKSQRLSLADLAARIQGRSVKVDDALGAKRLTVFNEESVPAQTILSAAAAVYGLQYSEAKDGNIAIAFRPVSTPRTAAELWPAMRTALPDSFLRQMANADANSEEKSPLRRTRFPIRYRASIQETAGAIRVSAIRQIRTAVEPELAKSIKQHVLLRETIPDVQMALGEALLVDIWESSSYLFGQDTPPAVSHFNDLYLVGGPYREHDKSLFNIYGCLMSGDGRGIKSAGPNDSVPYLLAKISPGKP